MMQDDLVSDWMTTDVISISPDTSLRKAHEIMKARSVRRLPVVEHGRLVGIVTLGDVRGAGPSLASSLSIWEINDLLAKLKVEKIMSRNPITIRKDESISQAAKIMFGKKIGGLPVVDEAGNLVGIITESDIFRMVAGEARKN